jgi:hypothetical protein
MVKLLVAAGLINTAAGVAVPAIAGRGCDTEENASGTANRRTGKSSLGGASGQAADQGACACTGKAATCGALFSCRAASCAKREYCGESGNCNLLHEVLSDVSRPYGVF